MVWEGRRHRWGVEGLPNVASDVAKLPSDIVSDVWRGVHIASDIAQLVSDIEQHLVSADTKQRLNGIDGLWALARRAARNRDAALGKAAGNALRAVCLAHPREAWGARGGGGGAG